MSHNLMRGKKLVSYFEFQGPPLEILEDAAISTPTLADGRLLPLVILDLRQRPDIQRLIDTQHLFPPGDVTTSWGREAKLMRSPDDFHLLFNFLRPVPATAAIRFDLRTRGAIADLAMRSKAIWLQGGIVGDKVSSTFTTHMKLIVGIGAEITRKKWEKLWRKALVRRYTAQGLSKEECYTRAENYMAKFDMVAHARQPPSGT